MPVLYPALAPTWYIAWPQITILHAVLHALNHLYAEANIFMVRDMQCINVGHSPNAKMQSDTTACKIRCHNGMSTHKVNIRVVLLLQ
jgi:hypothetical protein